MYRPTLAVMQDPYKMLPRLEDLVRQSVAQRRAGLVPALMGSGVRYQREPPGVEEWLTALETYRRGMGDCDKLAVWRAADLRLAGVDDARVVIKLVRPGLSHAVVYGTRGGRKTIWDPSAVLGMRGPA